MTRQRRLHRQRALLAAPPTLHDADYVVYRYVLPLVVPVPIFLARPTVSAEAFRALLRLVVGAEDYARMNAHHPRRRQFPELADERYKRCCVACLAWRGTCVLDSEWHALLECPSHSAARARARLQYPKLYDLPSASIEALVILLGRVHNNAPHLDSLCRLAMGFGRGGRGSFAPSSLETY